MTHDATERRIESWLNGPIDAQTRNEILDLQKSHKQQLRDAFSTSLSFGTGGMRELMGVGTARMNRYTIQMATQGLANYIKKSTEFPATVFISYDSRLHSKEFAWEAARVLAANGVTALITSDIRTTPFVSFGVRFLKCTAGIMITASHNPKEYNGYKVYWSDGGQVVSPHDKGIVEEVNKIEDPFSVKIAPEKNPLIQIVNPELDFEYWDAILKLQLTPEADRHSGDQLKIIYTSLHGAGIKLVPQALRRYGFTQINPVDLQIVPDGTFPTVKSPNPENREALSMGIKQMEDTLSDILIATDPDADRMAVAVFHKNKSIQLNGNQIAALLLEFICRTKKPTKKSAVITTIVTTDLLARICAHYKIPCFEVLTGFKYIGEMIHKWEKNNWPHEFLFGAEESNGYLYGTHSRDKDATIASCLLAEAALELKKEGRTLIDMLHEIYKQYGLFLEGQKSIQFPVGEEGMRQMHQKMEHLRAHPPREILHIPVETIEDYKTGIHHLPLSDVLLYRLADKSKLVIRPSGTEPKLKIYGGVQEFAFSSLPEAEKQCHQRLERLLNAAEKLLT